MIFNGDFTEEWGIPCEARVSKLVFIGRSLDAAILKAGFESCLATPDNLRRKVEALRFAVGDRVWCKVGPSPPSPAFPLSSASPRPLMTISDDC